MQEVDINTLICKDIFLIKNIPNNIIILGKINNLWIKYKYNELDLSKIECNIIYYNNQEGESIKNHILPNSLQELNCNNNQLTSLPKLPNSLQKLSCSYNQLTSLPELSNSLNKLYCRYNMLTSLPDLPNSLIHLYCDNNKLTSFADNQLPKSIKKLYLDYNEITSLPQLPNSLEELFCWNNKLKSLPELPKYIIIIIIIIINQDEELVFIPYCENVTMDYSSRFKIKDYPIEITNQKQWDQYMNYKKYQMNKIKSARK